MNWLGYSLITLVLMGILNALLKVASGKADAFSITFLTALAGAVTIVPFLLYRRKIEFSLYGLLAGLMWGIGIVCLNTALAKGEVSKILPIVSLGGTITAMIGIIFLKESITPLKIIGIILSAIAIVLLSL
jgi:uncharacterized membrane protein